MRSIEAIMHSEIERLNSINEKHGFDKMIEFARQTHEVYRSALRLKDGRRKPYARAYKRELVVSCLVFRKFIRDNDDVKK